MALDNQVIYELLLKDGFSPGLAKIDENVDKFETHLGHVKETALGVLEGLGIAFAGFKLAEFVSSGREEVEKLHQAEAALTNTMVNMGNYSEEAFEKSVKGAYDLSQGINFTQTQILGLQSELGLVGNIGEEEMERLIKVSGDLSAKFGMGLNEAGNLLAKAINNPEMARRLGMALKIDPAVMAHIQELAKHGKEAEARMELLAIAEAKVGGAAEAAFNADPMAHFEKTLYDVKITVGQLALDFLKMLIPAMQFMVTVVKDAITWVRDHKELLKTLGEAALVTAGILGGYAIAVNAAAIAEWFATGATAALSTAMAVLDVVLPIAAIIAIVAAFISWYKESETLRATLAGLWNVIKWFVETVGTMFEGLGKIITGAVNLDPNKIAEGWEESTKAMTDLTFNAGKKIAEAYKTGFDESMSASAAAKSLIPGPKNKTQAAPVVPPLVPPKTKAVGSKSITINVSIKDLIGTYNSNITNIKEGGKQLKDIVVSVLEDAINDFQVVATH